MEYVGRRVKKEFQGRGTFFGSVQAYLPATGFFKVMYDDGDSEELELSEVSRLLASPPLPLPLPLPPPPPPHLPEAKPEKRRRIINEGKVDVRSVVGCAVSGGTSWNPIELDLNSNEGVDADRGGNLGKLHGLDLNEEFNLELNEGLDLNMGVMQEGARLKKEMIDLNLDVNELENVRCVKKVRWFDLNVEVAEDGVSNLDDREGEPGGNGGFYVGGKGKDLVMHDDDGHLVHVDVEKGNVILDVENEGENGKCGTGVGYEEAGSISADEKGRGRKRKEVLDGKIESDAAEMIVLEVETGKLKLVCREETPFKKASGSVDYVDGVSGSASRGRNRAGYRANRASFAGQDNALNVARVNNQLSYSTLSALPYKSITGPGYEIPEIPVVLPPKVELPPSSGGLDLNGVSVFDVVSVYAFLRSFSTLLFLSPFELDDFVRCVNCNDSTLLFDSIHVSLLRTLRVHLKSLSNEGSASASVCLRSLNWDFLDLITWPVFVFEYLLLHSPRYIPGLDRCNFEPFQTDYYEMPVPAKVEILRHLCDDVMEAESFRLEINKRTLATERPSRRRKVAMDVASTSCIEEEDVNEAEDGNDHECGLCKMDGNLICCDGCPGAFHSRCVGVVSSLLPDGEWYCPECALDKDKPWKRMAKSIRGADLLGTDPYGRQYYSSCGYLLVSESCNDECSFWFYKRSDLPTLIEALKSSPFLYDKIISAICKHWDVIHGFYGTRSDPVSLSYSTQSDLNEKKILSIRYPTPSEALNKDEGFVGKNSDEKSAPTTFIETETSGHVKVIVETDKDAEVSEAFAKTDTLKEGGLDCSKRCTPISDISQTPGNLVNAEDQNTTTLEDERRKNLSSANHGYASSTLNSSPCARMYVNLYEFARTASSVFEELTSKSSDKSTDDAARSVEENVSGQMKLISNRSAEFSWSNIPNSNVKYRKEKCGWCFYCKVPEDEMDCLFIMKDSIPAVENFTSEVLDIGSTNRKNHLIDVICHIICIEDHLQGLLLGPWLDPNYSQLWCKSVLEAADLGSINHLLLKLESNLHHLAFSADWKKHVDAVTTMGSAVHIVRNSKQVSSKHGIGRTKESTPPSKAVPGLRLFWWRGGKASRKLFNWKVLPCSLASKAARQGGCKKVLGVHYPDSGEYVKRMKCIAWRAAVETSRSVEQLALQVRELYANIRWDDIGNTHFPSKMDKESKKPIRSFKNVIIRKKCCEGTVVHYLLDFGKRRFIPDIVKKHGSVLEDSSSERKKYWLEESHVPLHLLKAFEEKRIARKSKKIISGELHESSMVMMKPSQRNGLSYLFSRAAERKHYQCDHCTEDVRVRIREAVSCQNFKGFSHEEHAGEYAGSSTAEVTYICKKCNDGKLLQVYARKGKTELPKCEESVQLDAGKGKTELPKCEESVQLDAGKGKTELLKCAQFVQLDAGKGKAELPKCAKLVQLDAGKGKTELQECKNAASKALEPSCSGKRKQMGKEEQPVHSKKIKRDSLVVPPRRSARYAERISKLTFQTSEAKRQKKRTTVNSTSSYWLNGLRLSRRENDDRLVHFRSKMLLVLSGQETSISDKLKCSLCDEVEYTSELNYVACEVCGACHQLSTLKRSLSKFLCPSCEHRLDYVNWSCKLVRLQPRHVIGQYSRYCWKFKGRRSLEHNIQFAKAKHSSGLSSF